MNETEGPAPYEEPAIYLAGSMVLRIPQDAQFDDAGELADLLAPDYTDLRVDRHNPKVMLAGGPGADYSTLWIAVQAAVGTGALIAATHFFTRLLDVAYDPVVAAVRRLLQRARDRTADRTLRRVSFEFSGGGLNVEFQYANGSDPEELRKAARDAIQFLQELTEDRGGYPDVVYLEWDEITGRWRKPQWVDEIEVPGPRQPDR